MSVNLFDKQEMLINLNKFILQIIIFSIAGILPILILDNKFKKLRKSTQINKIYLDFSQFGLGLIVLYGYIYIYPKFSGAIIETLPGMYFSTFFFAIQTDLFNDIIKYIKNII